VGCEWNELLSGCSESGTTPLDPKFSLEFNSELLCLHAAGCEWDEVEGCLAHTPANEDLDLCPQIYDLFICIHVDCEWDDQIRCFGRPL